MVKELDYEELKNELISLLERYLDSPKDRKNRDRLSELWNHYFSAFPFMKKELEDALGVGEDFLCHTEPSEEKVKNVIEKLRSAEF